MLFDRFATAKESSEFFIAWIDGFGVLLPIAASEGPSEPRLTKGIRSKAARSELPLRPTSSLLGWSRQMQLLPLNAVPIFVPSSLRAVDLLVARSGLLRGGTETRHHEARVGAEQAQQGLRIGHHAPLGRPAVARALPTLRVLPHCPAPLPAQPVRPPKYARVASQVQQVVDLVALGPDHNVPAADPGIPRAARS